MAKKNDVAAMVQFKGKKKKFYDALTNARKVVVEQMKFHTDEALNSDGNDQEKRGMATHMADLGSDNSRHDMELRLLTEEGDVLQLIAEALERLESGEYGKCIDCGQPIQEVRLEIKPYARYCVKCKSIREKGMKPSLD